jgi:glycosyltransferase involved in cell wall biosynthesis
VVVAMSNVNFAPLVTVCIPMFNAEKYIRETFSRLSEQTYPNIEIVVVDDHSSDDSLQLVSEYEGPRFKVFLNPGKGACSARNHAFRKASGSYIKFMDVDDFCNNTLIERQMAALVGKTNQTVVFSPLRMLFSDGRSILPERKIDLNFEPAIDLQIAIWNFGGFNCPHCYLMHRDLVEKADGWNEALLKNQDGEFFARLLASADKAISVADDYVIWRQTGVGISSQVGLCALRSKFDSYVEISRVILSKSDTPFTREVCARYIGLFVFTQYPHIKSIMPDIEILLAEIGAPLILPDRRALKLLRLIIGWKLAVELIHKFNL